MAGVDRRTLAVRWYEVALELKVRSTAVDGAPIPLAGWLTGPVLAPVNI